MTRADYMTILSHNLRRLPKEDYDRAIEYFEENPPKGEYVVLLKGISDEELASEMKKRWDAISLMEHLGIYQSQGMTKKDAMKQVAKDRGLSKRDIYEALLE